jgi:Secretion system C-terminal sorting domain
MSKFLTVLFSILFTVFTLAQSASLKDFGVSNVSGTSFVGPSMAPVVFLDQAPNGVNGLFADSDCQLCGTLQQTVAENFVAAAGGSAVGITELVIWGGYYPEDIPNTTDDFTILIHSDAAGQPGAVIDTRSGLQAATRVQTGVILFGTHEYIFTFDFSASPIIVPSAGTYWLELYNNSVESGNFYWETGNVDGTHGVAGSGWFTTTPGTSWNLDPATDLSVQLNGDDNLPVEFVSFTANTTGTIVNLSWATATENNNQGFEVQRSTNGTDYLPVGFIQGHGTTTETQQYNFVDRGVTAGTYTYRLKQVDFNGTYGYSNTVDVDVTAPSEYSLDQNYPNPFNPSTKISFGLATDSRVSLKIFNILGQEVMTLFNGNMVAGGHEVNFDASGLNSGIYFYRLDATGVNGNNFSDVKKMILNK